MKSARYLLVIFILSAVMAWPLFTNKIIYLADGQYAVIKAVAMAESWRNGDLSARWTPDLIWGYGYPMFNFYAPGFFYATAILILLSVPVFLAFNICLFLALFGSGATMFAYAKELWGRQGGFLAAVAYLLTPYHILDLYSRGAISEFTAFVFFPLVMRAIYRLMRQANINDILFGILSFAGLVLSHNIAALFFSTICFAYLVFLFITDPQRRFHKAIAASSVFAGGAFLSMYFWLPAVLEKKYVMIERLLEGIYDYNRHFITLKQLIMPSWPAAGGELSFMLGQVHVALALGTVVFAFKIIRNVQDSGRHIVFFIGVTAVSIWFMVPASLVAWKNLPLLAFAEFPWRFLMCTTATLAFLIGGVLFIFEEKARIWVMVAGSVLFIAVNLRLCHDFGYQTIDYQSPRQYLYDSFPMDHMEYLPKKVNRIASESPPVKLALASGQGEVVEGTKKYLDEYYQVRVIEAGFYCYHTHEFPGWTVTANGRPVTLEENAYGLIVFLLPPGDHEVRIHFAQTPVRLFGSILSFLALIAFVAAVIFRKPLGRWIPNT